MTKLQYQGISDVRVIPQGDTINGAVAGGIPVSITFNQANNWVIDTTVAPYTGITAAMANAIKALPNGEFVDVTTTPQTPTHVTTYGASQGAQATATPTHVVSTGATPVITPGVNATAAAVGGRGANDQAGTFTATAVAAGGTVDGAVAIVTFAQPYQTAPKNVDVDPENAASEAAQLYATNITANGFSIAAHVVPAASAALAGSYAVTG